MPTRKLEVLYNSACPVCDAGVRRQQRLMQDSTARGDTAWTDITCHAEALARAGLTLEQVRRHLYARDTDGKLYHGAEAFAALWRETPGLRWLGALISLPVMRTIARVAYDWFADRLYNWNERHGRW